MLRFSETCRVSLRLMALSLCLMPAGAAGQAAAPRVYKVEPPNWWIGLPNPMLLLTGENLARAQISSRTRDVRVVRASAGLEGRYEFVWLDLGKVSSPENLILEVSTPGGRTEVRLPLGKRNPRGEGSRPGEGFSGFGPDDVIYLIMPDRFDDGDPGNDFPESGAYDRRSPRAYHGGDLRGIEQRLPYLKDLGVTTIWLTPIDQNDDRTGRDYHGYGATDLYAVEKHLGTLADYQALVKSAHAQGMKVLFDLVPNHVGPAHSWVDHPPTGQWLHGTREHHLVPPASFAILTDPHATSLEIREVLEGWFAGILPDMGTSDPVTAQYLRENALWWIETASLDGFRLDTFPYVDRPFWRDFHRELHGSYPRFRTVGEVFNADPAVTSYFAGGKTIAGIDTGLDTVFDFPLESAIRRVVLERAPASQLEDVLRHDWMFPHPENLVTFLGNHDTVRFMSEPGATVEKLKLAFSLLLTLRGIPQIYVGDEIGMEGGEDPDNRRDFPGGFPGDPQDAFSAQGRTPAQREVFDHVRALLDLRQQHPALRTGRLIHLFSDETGYAYVRESRPGGETPQAETLLVVMNNSGRPRSLTLDISGTPVEHAQALVPLLSAPAATLKGSQMTLSLPGCSLNIYELQ